MQQKDKPKLDFSGIKPVRRAKTRPANAFRMNKGVVSVRYAGWIKHVHKSRAGIAYTTWEQGR